MISAWIIQITIVDLQAILFFLCLAMIACFEFGILGESNFLPWGVVLLIICLLAGWTGVQIVKPAEIITGDSFNTSTQQPIVSLNAKDQTIGSGRFLLGSGVLSVNGEPRFFFYKRVNGDYLTLGSVPAMGALIREDGKDLPNIETITHHKKGDKKIFALWPGIIENWSDTQPDGITGTDTIIHVPEGTMTIPNPFNAQVA